jgi:(4S)-4-hydroxy-5-phosphonooxypentane-2,3-dione isomerase
MSVPHVVIATWTAKPGRGRELQEIIERMTPLSLNEKGCLMYQGHRSTTEDGVFVIYEQYRDSDALEKHTASQHFQRYVLGDAQALLMDRKRATFETI